jgi:hypothetical protein
MKTEVKNWNTPIASYVLFTPRSVPKNALAKVPVPANITFSKAQAYAFKGFIVTTLLTSSQTFISVSLVEAALRCT